MAKLSLNRTEIIGNLARDGELKYLANGQPKLEFSVGVSRSWKKGDDWQEETEWFNCLLWGNDAEKLSEFLVKGAPVYVEGRMQTRNWEGSDGVKHYRTELIANTVHLMQRPPKQNENQQKAPARQTDPDDLPWEDKWE